MSDLVIAVDGPAASGKGTLAKRLAAHFGLPHLDTGLLYRAVGQRMHDLGLDLADAPAAERIAGGFDPGWLDDLRLRQRDAGEAASRVAGYPGLRAALRRFQQDFAGQPGGAVLDGRDIGTVIAPSAPVKLWIDAAPRVRAERRFRELSRRGDVVTLEAVADDLARRDARDRPNMRIADDAVTIDTTALDIEAAFERALSVIDMRLSRRRA